MTNAINTSVNTNADSATQTADSGSNLFFDLHVRGMGYLNRVREVKPKKGPVYLSCGISALRGNATSPDKTYFDVSVVGDDANKLVRKAMDASNDKNRKVLLGFKLGDVWLDKFIYESGDKQGQAGASIKARLLLVEWMKVDGELVYQRSSDAQTESELPVTNVEAAEFADTDVEDLASAETSLLVEAENGGKAADADLPAEVKLEKDDPEFDAKKAELKALGYRWDGKGQVWKLAA